MSCGLGNKPNRIKLYLSIHIFIVLQTSPYFKILSFLIILHLLPFSAIAQKTVKVVYPLDSLSLKTNITWLDRIFKDKISNNISCVGLGEFSHGGHENVAFKSKMIQYLILNKNYRLILFEYPNVLLRDLNSYLLDHKSTDLTKIESIIHGTFGYDLSDTSLNDLIGWIKNYNLKHQTDPVSLAGIDIEGALTTFGDYFNEHILNRIDVKKASEFRLMFSKDKRDSLSIIELAWFDKNKELIKGKMESTQFQELLYNSQAARQKMEHLLRQKINQFSASAFRDSVMAENVMARGSSRTILWSHNIHVTTSDFVVSLGNYLTPKFATKYYSILTDFSKEANCWVMGNGGVLVSKKFVCNPKSTSFLVATSTKHTNGIVFHSDLYDKKRKAKFNDIDVYGNQRLVGSGRTFDALVFFENVNPLQRP